MTLGDHICLIKLALVIATDAFLWKKGQFIFYVAISRDKESCFVRISVLFGDSTSFV